MTALARRSFLAALVGFGALLRRRDAGATTIVPVTLEELTRRSELVVLGTVREVSSRWRGRFIVTDCGVSVDLSLKGELAVGERVGVRVAGGEVDGIGQMIPDAPMPERGASYVFFLQGREEGMRLLAHMTAAALPVTLGPDGAMVVGTAPGLAGSTSGRVTASPARSFPVGEFARAVRAAGAR